MSNGTTPSLRDVWSEMPENEEKAAEENVDRYLELILRMYERLQLESDESQPTH